jgi:RNA polymerase sigma-70 factor (ECF subfamily)
MRYSTTDDLQLIAAAQAGERAALDALLRRHYDRIHAVCRRITGNDSDAADAAQDAMIAVVRGLANFDGRSSFGTWVYRIATNASLDELRRRRRRPVSSVDDVDHDGHTTELTDPDSGVRIDGVSERLALETALAALAEDFRIPVVLRDVADLEYAEIALVTGVPVGTVKSRIARGRLALARALSQPVPPGNQTDPGQRPTPAHE